MLPTLVLSALLSAFPPSAGAPRSPDQEPARVELATLEVPAEAELDGFTSDVEGFPARRPSEARADVRDWSRPLGLARTFLGVWLAASALFGLVWGLLGWATRSRRFAART